ncbi:Single-stranded DNA-binding protein [Emticicia aquatica]|jgi:single-strand DNA-binding protein|uniref:Single-stranded DNA-binding protein n=1 Tax=Emticicia aquatica TaxID=1681835 RepID=A0ABN8ET07_9BACT|nr:single-stranded DNA-binding protein [Emticicia aquatica]CAH0996160.1 Single-stranded DNA-binding protein [Emticicia aquatica]
MNSVKLIGNVGSEVNVLSFENGKKASFSLATNETYTNKKNEEVKNTTWHNVVAWGKVAEICADLVSKGKLVTIEGKLNYRNYVNKESKIVYVTEIIAYKVTEAEAK